MILFFCFFVFLFLCVVTGFLLLQYLRCVATRLLCGVPILGMQVLYL